MRALGKPSFYVSRLAHKQAPKQLEVGVIAAYLPGAKGPAMPAFLPGAAALERV